MAEIEYRKRILFFIFFFLVSIHLTVSGQTEKYKQFWNEFQFTRTLSDKWVSEINLGSAFSNTPAENNILKTNVQRNLRIWGHYYYSPRWKFSSFLAYYYNKDIPDIGQYESPEWRFALQGIYYFHKICYTLSTRMRTELRFIRNQDLVYEDVYRYRQQIKFLKPINSQLLRKGVFYFVSSDEIFVKSAAKTTGLTFFDRNRFATGAGYIITDNFQVELTYVNEYMPRDNYNQLYHAFSLSITFNNFLTNLKKKIAAKPLASDQPD
jgi:hypothetical protein